MTEGQPQVARVAPGEVTSALVTALYTAAVVSRVEAGVVALTGPGAVTSFQGLLTNDVELPGDGSFVYGARHGRRAVGRAGDGPGGGGRPARRAPGGRRRGGGRPRGSRAEPDPRGVAASRRRGGRQDHPPGSAPRRDRRRVVYQGLLHRPGDGRAAALPRPREPAGARLAVRSGAAGRAR